MYAYGFDKMLQNMSNSYSETGTHKGENFETFRPALYPRP